MSPDREDVQRLAGRNVLVVGDLMLDRYVWGDAERISQARKVLGLSQPYFLYVGGWEERKNLPFLLEAFAPEELGLASAAPRSG